MVIPQTVAELTWSPSSDQSEYWVYRMTEWVVEIKNKNVRWVLVVLVNWRSNDVTQQQTRVYRRDQRERWCVAQTVNHRSRRLLSQLPVMWRTSSTSSSRPGYTRRITSSPCDDIIQPAWIHTAYNIITMWRRKRLWKPAWYLLLQLRAWTCQSTWRGSSPRR